MNLFKYLNHSLVSIEVFDLCFTLSILKNSNIKIYKLKKIDNFHYSFITNNKNIKFLSNKFKSLKIINKIGLFNIFKKNILRMSTAISLVASLLLFSFMNNLIMGINISGDSSSLVDVINTSLNEKGIKKYTKRKKDTILLQIEKEIAIELYDKIEWIEIKNQGLNIQVNFLKRRDSFDIKNSKKAIYATKQGIIKSFNIEKGIKKVNVNDLVYPGQLLIDGYLVDSKENMVYIGAIGSVYAYTWFEVSASIEINNNFDEASTYLILEEKIKEKIDKELTGDDEYIENQKILKFEIKNGIGYLSIHYTLVEDITR